jgi:hypothetical protein
MGFVPRRVCDICTNRRWDRCQPSFSQTRAPPPSEDACSGRLNPFTRDLRVAASSIADGLSGPVLCVVDFTHRYIVRYCVPPCVQDPCLLSGPHTSSSRTAAAMSRRHDHYHHFDQLLPDHVLSEMSQRGLVGASSTPRGPWGDAELATHKVLVIIHLNHCI